MLQAWLGKALSPSAAMELARRSQRRDITGPPVQGDQQVCDARHEGRRGDSRQLLEEDLRVARSQAENESTKSRCGGKGKTYQDLQLAASPLPRVV